MPVRLHRGLPSGLAIGTRATCDAVTVGGTASDGDHIANEPLVEESGEFRSNGLLTNPRGPSRAIDEESGEVRRARVNSDAVALDQKIEEVTLSSGQDRASLR